MVMTEFSFASYRVNLLLAGSINSFTAIQEVFSWLIHTSDPCLCDRGNDLQELCCVMISCERVFVYALLKPGFSDN